LALVDPPGGFTGWVTLPRGPSFGLQVTAVSGYLVNGGIVFDVVWHGANEGVVHAVNAKAEAGSLEQKVGITYGGKAGVAFAVSVGVFPAKGLTVND